MRTLVNIPDRQIKDLEEICRIQDLSRAEVIRRAIAFYLESQKVEEWDVFGIWEGRGIDGLAYQNQMRTEW